MEYNHAPISLREGHVYLDGVEIADSIKCEIKMTPDVWTGRQLGERTPSSRWLGCQITGNMTRRRSTPWLREAIQRYNKDKGTPEFTIQGIMNDENSDYYAAYDQINGVQSASPVMMQGVKIGTVTDIVFDPARSEQVVLRLTVKRQYAIPSDSEARIVSSSLMGSKAQGRKEQTLASDWV